MRSLTTFETVGALSGLFLGVVVLGLGWRIALCLLLVVLLAVVVLSAPNSTQQQTTATAPPPLPPRPTPTPAHQQKKKLVKKVSTPKLTGDAQRASIQSKVMAELLATERSYVGKLSVIRDVFLDPLRAAKPPVITTEQIRTIFSDVEIIMSYNKELLQQLEQWRPGTASLTPGDVAERFASVSGYLATYQTYCNNYEAAAAMLTSLKTDANGPFARFLGHAQQDARCEGLNLESLLIQPVQRIPRYLLLLKELRKHTPAGSADIAKLDSAIATVSRLATKVNEAKGDAQSKAMVFAMQSQFTSLAAPLISEPSRRFVREGLFSFVPDGVTPPDKWSSHRRQLVCFSDLVIIAKANADAQGRREVLHELPMRDLRIATTESSGVSVLVLSSASKHVVLAFASCTGNDDTKSWFDLLRQCSSELQAKAASFIRRTGTL